MVIASVQDRALGRKDGVLHVWVPAYLVSSQFEKKQVVVKARTVIRDRINPGIERRARIPKQSSHVPVQSNSWALKTRHDFRNPFLRLFLLLNQELSHHQLNDGKENEKEE
jgi:hypothetical protein